MSLKTKAEEDNIKVDITGIRQGITGWKVLDH
jgi:hypothetical protein